MSSTTHPDLDQLATAVEAALAPLVETHRPPGLTWGLDLDGQRRVGALGHLDRGRETPAAPDTIYRISSMTKPVTAVAALTLVEEGVLTLDQPIDELLPELAGRRVLLRPDGPLDETEPAVRPISVEDLLTFRLGHGIDFASLGAPNPLEDRLAELGLGAGPPAPRDHLPPEAWLAALGTLPLRHQPGQRWLYNTGAEVLGVLLARACGTSLEEVLTRQVLAPLRMTDTAFSFPLASADGRAGACFGPAGPGTGEVGIHDAADGQWGRPPVFEGGDAGLVSTVHDYLSFAAMLRDGGVHVGTRVLSAGSVRDLTTNHLTAEQVRAGGPSPDGSMGWGLGVGVALREPSDQVVGNYGWDGGLGSTWRNDTGRGVCAVLLTNQMWGGPTPPAVTDTFWAALAEQLPLGER